jgi:hypothetical protein
MASLHRKSQLGQYDRLELQKEPHLQTTAQFEASRLVLATGYEH